MKIVDGLRYTANHEWVLVDGESARIGITDHAQDALGTIVYRMRSVAPGPLGATITMPRVGGADTRPYRSGAPQTNPAIASTCMAVCAEAQTSPAT